MCKSIQFCFFSPLPACMDVSSRATAIRKTNLHRVPSQMHMQVGILPYYHQSRDFQGGCNFNYPHIHHGCHALHYQQPQLPTCARLPVQVQRQHRGKCQVQMMRIVEGAWETLPVFPFMLLMHLVVHNGLPIFGSAAQWQVDEAGCQSCACQPNAHVTTAPPTKATTRETNPTRDVTIRSTSERVTTQSQTAPACSTTRMCRCKSGSLVEYVLNSQGCEVCR